MANNCLTVIKINRCQKPHFMSLTHWGRVTHICVGKLTISGSDNGLSLGRRKAIISTNAGILLMRPLGTNFSEILLGIQTFSFNKMHLKMSSAKWRPLSRSQCVKCQIWSIHIVDEARCRKQKWPIFGLYRDLIAMRLKLDVSCNLMDVYTRFQVHISKHVEESWESFPLAGNQKLPNHDENQ